MVDEGGFDPCECIFSHENGMRRLISLLRNSQTYCTDNECFPEMPGLQAQSDSGDMSFLFVSLLWVFVALFLFSVRPSSLRRDREGDSKPANAGLNPTGGPPPPPPSIH